MSDLQQLTARLADRHAIVRELVVGGMATVYLARAVKRDREVAIEVAIKVLTPELGAMLGVDRLLAEINHNPRLPMRLLLVALVAGTMAVPALAQQQAGTQPPAGGRDSRARRADSVFASFDRTDSPGCALGVYQNENILYERGYGMANLELGIANTPRTVFEIGSISKQFTAMSILLLQQDGKLSVNDPVRKYIPELPAYADRITIRHLLSHTSGIRDHFGLQEIDGVSFDGVQDTVDYLRLITRQQTLNFEPGTRYLYSNSGFVLLAQIVYRVSGEPLSRFAATRIFAPLGMRDTRFQDDHTQIIPNRATAYMPRGDQFAVRMSMFDQMAGAAGIHTTVEDFSRWVRNYDEGTIGRSAIDAMSTPMRLNNDSLAVSGTDAAYGFGINVGTYRGLPMISHTGSWGGYRSAFMRFPKQHIAVATFCNHSASGPDSLLRKVAAIYLAREMAPDPDSAFRVALAGAARVDVAPGSTARLAGVWRNIERGEVRRTELAGDTLVFPPAADSGRHTALVPIGGLRFRAGPGTQVAFEGESASGPTRLVVRTGTGQPVIFVHTARAELSAAQLAEYEGSYYNSEVDVTWLMRIDAGKLVAFRKGRRIGPLTPTYRDGFVEGAMVLDFTRDAKGHVAGFLVEAGRVRHLQFARTLPANSAQ
jgi:CubicO group peptidase (beta-lactamase class C family)